MLAGKWELKQVIKGEEGPHSCEKRGLIERGEKWYRD